MTKPHWRYTCIAEMEQTLIDEQLKLETSTDSVTIEQCSKDIASFKNTIAHMKNSNEEYDRNKEKRGELDV